MSLINWQVAKEFSDIFYHKAEGIAKITINRPEVRNAFRPLTVMEMSKALDDARDDQSIGVIILTGEGGLAFCSGGDQRVRGDSGYRDDQGIHRLNVLDFQRQIRTCPKPVIAMVATPTNTIMEIMVKGITDTDTIIKAWTAISIRGCEDVAT